jgi:hypothetical protein
VDAGGARGVSYFSICKKERKRRGRLSQAGWRGAAGQVCWATQVTRPGEAGLLQIFISCGSVGSVHFLYRTHLVALGK